MWGRIYKKSFILISLFVFSVSTQAFDKCGKRIEEGRKGFFSLYECNDKDELVSRKVFKGYDFIEESFYNTGELRPYKRRILESELTKPLDYYFTYTTENENNLNLKTITVRNFDGQTLGEHKVNLNEDEIEAFRGNSKLKPKALIIDSGFSFTHPSLKDHVYFNSNETFNDEDSDEDGIKDNFFGVHGTSAYEGSANHTPNINEPLKLKSLGAPLSHGTAVADFAMRDLKKTGFIGMGGDFHSPAFLYKALEFINKNNILVVNLSIGFGDRNTPGPVSSSSYDAMAGLIMSAPNTLFVIAAGNSSLDFDTSSYSEFPACLKGHNILTVGALNTDKIEESKLDDYKPSYISNVGARCVDFFAPGENVTAAALGDITLKATGTSFAAPYTVNQILKIYEEDSSLSSKDIKELIKKHIHVPKNSVLPSRTGGFLKPI